MASSTAEQTLLFLIESMSGIGQFTVEKLQDYDKIKEQLIRRWTKLHETPNVFRYKLNVRNEKILDGSFQFLVQVYDFLCAIFCQL